MSSDLRERMQALAEDAPREVQSSSDLWGAGVRRGRRQRAAAVASAVAAVVLVGGLGSQLVEPSTSVPADAPESQLHLARSVYAPHPWTRGTDEAGPPGPLAALSMATRHVTEGAFGKREVAAPFGVSAVDGSAVFLDLPGTLDGDGSSRLGYGAIALSPNGRKVGYVRYADEPAASEAHEDLWHPSSVIGWGVYDTVTGVVTELRVPGVHEVRGMDAFEIRFTGDSRYLLTNYSPAGSDGSRDDALFAWDVETGKAVEVEGTGYYWLPNPGSGPHGVVWSRDRRILTFDPASGETRTVTTPQEVVEASYGPDGRALAYVGHRPTKPNEPAPWHLYVGPSERETRRVDLGVRSVGLILGWRNDHEVVVNTRGLALRFVDVRTGDHEPGRIGGWTEGIMMAPAYASDLWRNPLVDGVKSSAEDPRWWLRPAAWAAGAVLGGALGIILVVRRRRAGA
jgi:hypothetical protein